MIKNDYYEQEELWNRELTNQEIERIEIVKEFIPNDVNSILDAGCGNGAISNNLDNFEVTAIDRSKEALKYVKNKSVEGSLDNLPFDDNSFDLVMCSDVLEHLPYNIYNKTINELKRVSRKYILIISPNSEDLEANQSKCISCGTVFHMNWHISSISMDKIINNFRDEFSPFMYTFFGEKWSSEPKEKYKEARLLDLGYKNWENAVCPMCNTKQKNKDERLKEIDLKLNKKLNGFYNQSTEFIVLLTSIDNKNKIFDFNSVDEEFLLSKNEISTLDYINRQCILTDKKTFKKDNTIFYPEYSYYLDFEDNKKLLVFPYLGECELITFEFLDNLKGEVLINIYDLERSYLNIGKIILYGTNDKKNISFKIPNDIIPVNEGLIFEIVSDGINVSKDFIIGKTYINDDFQSISFYKKSQTKILDKNYIYYGYENLEDKYEKFLIVDENVLIFDKDYKCFFLNIKDTFEYFNYKKTDLLNKNFIRKKIELDKKTSKEEIENIKFKIENLKSDMERKSLELEKSISRNYIKINKNQQILTNFENKIKEDMMLEIKEIKNDLESVKQELLDVEKKQKEELELTKKTSTNEISKIREELDLAKKTSTNEISKIREELQSVISNVDNVKSELYFTKEGLYRVSNTVNNLIYKLKNPIRSFFSSSSNKKVETKKNNHVLDKLKHLVVITPDVRVDRRTVQMCQSLIKTYDIRCTIIAALEEKDDFVTDKLKVKRIDPNKTKKYILKPSDWNDGSNLNLEEFYWLHPHYLNMALYEDADYIMCCDLPVLPAAVYASKIKNIPLVYDAHELYPEQAIFPKDKREFYTRIESHFIKYPDLVITVNDSIAEEMSKRYEINKPEVILNALDAPNSFNSEKDYDYFREKLPIKKEQKIVLFQGGYSPNRNLELFVKSAKFIKNDSIVLVLMGFGDFGQVLKDISMEDKTIDKNVFFFPAVDQSVLLEYSSSADVGIIPYPHIDLNSYYCTPNKLFEFIQAGLPIIANDSPELNRFVIENNIGYSKKIETEEDIANMIDKYFTQGIDYKKNMENVKKNICWNVEEKKFNKMMKIILESK